MLGELRSRLEGRHSLIVYAKESHGERLADRQTRHHMSGLMFIELTADSALTENIVLITHQTAADPAARIANFGIYRNTWRRTDPRSSDYSSLNWSVIGRREMHSKRADSVGMEYAPDWNRWNPRCSPHFLLLFVQGGAAVNQRVAGSSPAGGAIFSQVNQRVSEPAGPLASWFLGDW